MRRLSSPRRLSRRTIYRNDPGHHLPQPLPQQQEPRQRCAIIVGHGDQDGYCHGDVCMSYFCPFIFTPLPFPSPVAMLPYTLKHA